MTGAISVTATDVLLIVDIQNDFCPGGALAVPDGHLVIPIINRMARHFRHVVLTQDWHPRDHTSFASSHPGRNVHQTIDLSYGPQILWPDHCVQGTLGAEFVKELHVPHAELVLRKGCAREIDSYSAFYENDRETPTGMGGYLRERGFTRLFIAGLAFDFCVQYSAEGAHRIGFTVLVVEDACRAIDVAGSATRSRTFLSSLGIMLVSSAAIGGGH